MPLNPDNLLRYSIIPTSVSINMLASSLLSLGKGFFSLASFSSSAETESTKENKIVNSKCFVGC